MKTVTTLIFLLFTTTPSLAAEAEGVPPPPEAYCKWEMVNYSIPASLCGLKGEAPRGEKVVADAARGNCLACHELPIKGVEAYGTIAPPLSGVANRLSEAQLRLRVVDSRHLNPNSIMPGFYRNPSLINRPGKGYEGRTFLAAQDVEDVIAYLVTLK
ncbi:MULTISPECIES: sulfur oxidation c-type cytochrome SoxX [Thiothrix]|jgi:sulfur-oxidizing protein SoxX|uniref:Sulfur oxidation c-type cytochrome SoxX n=2 Tax=Thiothrix TaxID=1030 RepID=A0A975IGA9_9GAMM|nr:MULTISPECIES: sulfur oxidation c-type cytochrome SoxX [Thiothrix]MDX9988541.1 sulfur oxidation c-type cytochrome SoxX [Thiothrix unzii]QTR52398.1 sulfur oxidation c-type cytochrome SoxX [Thiothrix unzii]